MSDFTPGIRRYLDKLRQVFDALNLAEMDAVAQVFQRAYEEGSSWATAAAQPRPRTWPAT